MYDGENSEAGSDSNSGSNGESGGVSGSATVAAAARLRRHFANSKAAARRSCSRAGTPRPLRAEPPQSLVPAPIPAATASAASSTVARPWAPPALAPAAAVARQGRQGQQGQPQGVEEEDPLALFLSLEGLSDDSAGWLDAFGGDAPSGPQVHSATYTYGIAYP